MSLLIHDLDSATAAYKKAGTFPGQDTNARAQRGLANVGSARDKAKQSLTLANDLAKRAQLASAIDNYRAAAYANPRLADAHKKFIIRFAKNINLQFSNRSHCC
jgi:hypothetical protein